MNVLFLAPYPLHEAPSQRFRFEHFLPLLAQNHIPWHFQSFYSSHAWKRLYLPGHHFAKITGLLAGYLRRCLVLLHAHQYQVIFIHRELTPLGPPVFEWLLANVCRKRIIYDFDDAIWMADQTKEPTWWRWLKWRKKVSQICTWSWRVSAGNDYLASFASQYCQQVHLLPTVVDTFTHTPPTSKYQLPTTNIPTIGWTGSHSTLFYLNEVLPVLQDLEQHFEFRFVVIANRNPQLPLRHFEFIPWKKETEIEDLSTLDIGIMPLLDDEWAKGKCGFKLIQYMALGLPVVASPVGVNSQLVKEGEHGFLVKTATDWKVALERLLVSADLRKQMGAAGRKRIEQGFSVESHREKFLGLLMT